MRYAHVDAGNKPAELPFDRSFKIGSTQYPANWLTISTDDDRRRLRIFPIVDDEVPEGKQATGYTLAKDGEVVRRHWDLVDLPAPEPDPGPAAPTQAVVAAVGDLAITDWDVQGIETSVGISGAMLLDVGLVWIFFSTPFDDTAYLPLVQSPGVNADITAQTESYIEVTVTDRTTGAPTNPTRLILSVQRTQ